MKIPLFDLDGTLMRGGVKPYDEALNYAIKEVLKIEGKKTDIVTHGKTESELLIDIGKLYGLSEEEIKKYLPDAFIAMERYFSEHIDEGEYISLHGAKEILEELKKRGFKIGVLTGNLEPIAWKRLERCGLREYIDFGAFGNLAHTRVELIEIARNRSNAMFGEHRPKSDFVIIGDTPKDIECARQGGIQSIGVATGSFRMDELEKCGGDLVISSLKEQDAILEFLGVDNY